MDPNDFADLPCSATLMSNYPKAFVYCGVMDIAASRKLSQVYVTLE